jgi:hypothetical protein
LEGWETGEASAVKDLVRARAPKSEKTQSRISPVRIAGWTPAVTLTIKRYCLPAILDSGSSYSFIRREVFQQIQSLGLPCSVKMANRTIHMAAGHSCVIKEAVSLQIKLHSFSWKYDFLVFGDFPVPCILGADFLSFAKMQLDFATSSYTFAFEGSCRYNFEPLDFSSLYSHCLIMRSFITCTLLQV